MSYGFLCPLRRTSFLPPWPIQPARDGEQTVRVLTNHAGVSQPAVSKHLAVLKLAGLVLDRREGRQTHFSVQPQGLTPLIDWIGLYGAFWRDRFDRLETLLNRMDQ
jgi:DNA-binding transcriptional ArsR family regulator